MDSGTFIKLMGLCLQVFEAMEVVKTKYKTLGVWISKVLYKWSVKKKRQQETNFEQTLVSIRTMHEKTAFFTYQLFISLFSGKKEKIETVWQISHP